jgi:hypothetical protein
MKISVVVGLMMIVVALGNGFIAYFDGNDSTQFDPTITIGGVIAGVAVMTGKQAVDATSRALRRRSLKKGLKCVLFVGIAASLVLLGSGCVSKTTTTTTADTVATTTEYTLNTGDITDLWSLVESAYSVVSTFWKDAPTPGDAEAVKSRASVIALEYRQANGKWPTVDWLAEKIK